MSSKRPVAPPPRIQGFTYIRLLGSGGFSDVHPFGHGNGTHGFPTAHWRIKRAGLEYARSPPRPRGLRQFAPDGDSGGGPALLPVIAGILPLGTAAASFAWWGRNRLRAY